MLQFHYGNVIAVQSALSSSVVQMHVRAGEDVLLLENNDPHMWKIRNGRNQESEVPATIVLIRGPCADAIDSAARLIACF